ncbi:MAG TPA: nuclear transport factor 2 family protein [Candidatus Eisenbacteria bacterium]|nr:nuclear transport factor 2 family protein [Candidatus Eisenbacteria bacterium]
MPRRTAPALAVAPALALPLLAVTLSAASAATPPRAADDSATVRRAIDAGNAGYIAGWTKPDAKLFASNFALDGAILTQTGRIIYGRDAIARRMTDVFKLERMSEGRIATTHVFILGDVAYETGRWWFTFVTDGKAEPDSGRFVEVWKRQRPGVWKMWRDIGIPKD